MTEPDPEERYDVAILGRHLATGLLGAVLAAQGLRVLLVPARGDDDEPAGETTVPYTAEVLLLLARRFGVPEIAAFGLFRDLPARVRRSSGVKKSLGFLYHRPGRPQDAAETVQFHVPTEHGEWHPYRPVADAYAVQLATDRGAALAPSPVVDADTGPDGAWVRTEDGTDYRCRFVVDAAGATSPLVRRHGGFDVPARLDQRSITYTAQLAGLTPFERIVAPPRAPRATRNSPWSHGTVHHLFDGGWLQLAHFDNHPESRNETTSATLSLDARSPAARGLPDDPDSAVATVTARYPDLARQLGTGRAVAGWTRHDDQQRTASVTHGPRWIAFERSATRSDMFLSRDVTMSAELVHALAPTLIRAVGTDDFTAEPFARVARFQSALGEFNDRLQVGARIACRDFGLWNAFARVWLLWQILADLSLKRARLDCAVDATAEMPEAADEWDAVERFERGGIWFEVPDGLRELMERALCELDAVQLGVTAPREAADRIFALLAASDIVPPLYDFADPRARVYRFTLRRRLRMLWWVKTAAPPAFRRLLTRDNVTSVTSASSR